MAPMLVVFALNYIVPVLPPGVIYPRKKISSSPRYAVNPVNHYRIDGINKFPIRPGPSVGIPSK